MKLHERVLRMCQDKSYNPVHRQERLEAAIQAGIWEISHELTSRISSASDDITDESDLNAIITEVLEEML